MYSKGSHLYSFVMYSSDTNISHIKSYMYWAAWASAFLSQAWHIAWLSLIYQSSRTGRGKTWPIPNIIGVLLDIVERCESKLQIVLKRTISMPHIISHWIHQPSLTQILLSPQAPPTIAEEEYGYWHYSLMDSRILLPFCIFLGQKSP